MHAPLVENGKSNRTRALAFVLSLATTLATSTAAFSSPQIVAELFTSQGCSSCPPADRLLKDLNGDGAILPLTMAVDYWDYLGWPDTLASKENSDRQRAYAAKRGDRAVYTPQLVVNGKNHVVGSRENEVRSALGNATPFTAQVTMTSTDMALEITIDGALPEGADAATLYLLRISDTEEVAIKRGENAGQTITYQNVVKSMQSIGMWMGGHTVFRMPKSEIIKDANNKCAVLVQIEDKDGPGAIIGANIMDLAMATAPNEKHTK